MLKVISGDSNITMKLDCFIPCTSGNQALGSKGAAGWETVGTLARAPLGGGAPREILEQVMEADWSPDGSRFTANVSGKTLFVWDTATGEVTATLEGHDAWILWAAWSPDGKSVYVASTDDDTVVRFDRLADRRSHRLSAGHRRRRPGRGAAAPWGGPGCGR